jgi:hypothetical protein
MADRLAGSWWKCFMCGQPVFKTGEPPKRSCPACGCRFGENNWRSATRADVKAFFAKFPDPQLGRIII